MQLSYLYQIICRDEYSPESFFLKLKQALQDAKRFQHYLGVPEGNVHAALSPRQEAVLQTALSQIELALQLKGQNTEGAKESLRWHLDNFSHEIADFIYNYGNGNHSITPTEYLVLNMAVQLYEAVSAPI